MKAVIMAGGKGTRLRPLTCHTPKPMVPLLNRPCLEYAIELLKAHGITEIAITLQYLPDVIKSYFGDGSAFGVSLHYFTEHVPLGTAGSVKNCEAFLDERFIVLSGDALTDFDLTAALDYHLSRRALATLVLARVEHPLEFGVVMTEDSGRIVRFLEKPNWSEVFSDTVNTGIYILEPEVLDYIAPGVETDFSKQVFPYFLEHNLPMYGYIAKGYWSDIGTLEVYRQAQIDMLDGRVNVRIQAEEIAPRIFMEPGVRIGSAVRLEGPLYLGREAVLQDGASAGPYAILGSHVHVGAEAHVGESILWENSLIASHAEVNGSTLGRNVRIGTNAVLADGCVVGDESRIGANAHLKAGVKVWPRKEIDAFATLTASLIYSQQGSRQLFGSRGISGEAGQDITADFVARLAAAYAYQHSGRKVLLSACAHPYSQLLKHGMLVSLSMTGLDCVDAGVLLVPMSRFATRHLGCSGGIHIGMDEQKPGTVTLRFFDRDGLPISRDEERKLENAYWQETYRRAAPDQPGKIGLEHQVQELYLQELLASIDRQRIQGSNFRVWIECEERLLPALLAPLLARLGVTATFGPISAMRDADLGIKLSNEGEQFQLFTAEREELSEEKLLALQIMCGYQQEQRIGLPVHAAQEVERLAVMLNLDVVRTKASARAMLETTANRPLQPLHDALCSLVWLLAYLAERGTSLGELTRQLPDSYMVRETVYCPWSSKGKVMRRMMEEIKGKPLELLDGIKVFDPQGWVLILPDSEEACVRVISQGNSADDAAALAVAYARRIADYQQA